MRIRDSSDDEFDETWAVFDVDDFDISEALRIAGKGDIRVASSNPCFELWLLLHFQDQRAYLANYRAVLALLKKHLPKYDKGNLAFGDYQDGIEDACRRARAQLSTETPNPKTSVVEIAQKILG